MTDPVMNRQGQSYERSAIVSWIVKGGCGSTCPITNEPLQLKDLIPNTKLRNEIFTWSKLSGIGGLLVGDDDGFVRKEEVVKCIAIALSPRKQTIKRTFLGRLNKVRAPTA